MQKMYTKPDIFALLLFKSKLSFAMFDKNPLKNWACLNYAKAEALFPFNIWTLLIFQIYLQLILINSWLRRTLK